MTLPGKKVLDSLRGESALLPAIDSHDNPPDPSSVPTFGPRGFCSPEPLPATKNLVRLIMGSVFEIAPLPRPPPPFLLVGGVGCVLASGAQLAATRKAEDASEKLATFETFVLCSQVNCCSFVT